MQIHLGYICQQMKWLVARHSDSTLQCLRSQVRDSSCLHTCRSKCLLYEVFSIYYLVINKTAHYMFDIESNLILLADTETSILPLF